MLRILENKMTKHKWHKEIIDCANGEEIEGKTSNGHWYEDEKHEQYDKDLKFVENVMASTPAQSLQAHDDEVIERCAKVCDECGTTAGAAHFIRELKGKQNV